MDERGYFKNDILKNNKPYEEFKEKYFRGEYAVLQKRLRSEDEDEPTPPPMQVADCAAQMLAAQQEHDKTAPVYASIADCQSEGVRCEATPAGALTAGYRPIYGGTYLYPYSESNWIYIKR